MHDIYSRLVSEAAGLVKLTKRSTLSASEFQTATRLILRKFIIAFVLFKLHASGKKIPFVV